MKNVIFFDGVCHLCNGAIDYVLRRDRHGVFQVASLQGRTAETLLTENERKSLESIILYQDGQRLTKSQAILTILSHLGWPEKILAFFGRVVPTKLANLVYEFVARNRYRWFGTRETCRLPSPEERERMLE